MPINDRALEGPCPTPGWGTNCFLRSRVSCPFSPMQKPGFFPQNSFPLLAKEGVNQKKPTASPSPISPPAAMTLSFSSLSSS